jgi:hypothetical protein
LEQNPGKFQMQSFQLSLWVALWAASIFWKHWIIIGIKYHQPETLTWASLLFINSIGCWSYRFDWLPTWLNLVSGT